MNEGRRRRATWAMVGWISSFVFGGLVLVAAVGALFERNQEVCAWVGNDYRDRVFSLFPLGQTCPGDTSTKTALIQNAGTIVLLAAALGTISCWIQLLVRRLIRHREGSDRWLFRAIPIGLMIAALPILRAMVDSQIPSRVGVNPGLTMQVALGFLIGLFATAVIGVLALGRDSRRSAPSDVTTRP